MNVLKMNNQIYLSFHNKIFDNIIKNKRLEILKIIKEELKRVQAFDCLDIGTTPDIKNESSNFIIKNLKLNLKDPVSPVLVEDMSDKNSFYVVMPMKI